MLTPVLPIPRNRRREILLRILQHLFIEAARLQPHSRYTCLFCVRQQRLGHCWRRDYGQRVRGSWRVAERGGGGDGRVVLVEDVDAWSSWV